MHGAAIRRLLRTEIDTTEAAGLLAAVASVGPSFERGLLPRSTGQQAVVTGVVAAANYGLTTTAQAFVEALARRLAGEPLNNLAGSRIRSRQVGTRRAVLAAADLAAFGAGVAVQRVFAQRPQEPLRRAGYRALGWRLAAGAIAGSLTLAADAVTDRLTRRRTEARVSVPAVLVTGAALSSGLYLRRRRALAAAGVGTDALGREVERDVTVTARRAVVAGIGISGALYAASRAESALAGGIGRVAAWAAPSLTPVAKAVGHAGCLGMLGYAGAAGVRAAYRRTEHAGEAIEPAYNTPPSSSFVSGSPHSLVDWATIAREGRRYVNMALTAEDIAAVTGATDAKDPIRVFVGLASADTPSERADLAMRELEAMGAFERKVIAYFSPTGTGYVNYVAAETLEYLTEGDVASVAIQYSVRPSFLSLERVRTAWEENLAFLTAVSWKLRSLPEGRRPRLVMFGESLGSQAGQDVFLRQGARGIDLMLIDRALFIGSPFASAWRQAWLADPARWDPAGYVVEVASYDEWLALPPVTLERARIALLTHHDDPIPKFGAPLFIQAPGWMGSPGTREFGVPPESSWRPLVTFLITFVDLLNADHVVPGRFEAFGHDYRKDLAQLVRAALDLPATEEQMTRVEQALRARELHWAERRVLSEQLDKVEGVVRRQLGSWGVDTSAVPSVLNAPHVPRHDPFAAAVPAQRAAEREWAAGAAEARDAPLR